MLDAEVRECRAETGRRARRRARARPDGACRTRASAATTRSATSSVVSPSPHAPRVASGNALRDLGVGEALPAAEVLLAQVGVDRDREPVASGDGRRRVARASEIARVHGDERLGGEARRRGRCAWRDPGRVERNVGVALDAPTEVPVGLTVSRKQESAPSGYRTRMPIVQVTALRQRVGVDIDAVSRALVVAVGRELGEDPSGTWVTWQTLAPGGYREGEDDAPSEQPLADAPADRPHQRLRGARPRSDRPHSLRRRRNDRPRARARARERVRRLGRAARRDGSTRAAGCPARRIVADGSRARRQGRARHRLEPGNRPRDRNPPRRGGRRRRLLRARGG